MIWFLISLTVVGMFCALTYPLYAVSAPKKKLVLKTIASLAFVAGAIVAAQIIRKQPSIPNMPNAYSYANMILIALIFGMGGDIFLALPGVFPRYAKLVTVIGGSLFLTGHIIYLVLFFGLASFNYWLLLLLPLFFGIPFLFLKPLSKMLGKAAPLAAVYSSAIGLLIMSTLSLLITVPSAMTAMLLVAAVFFSTSDYILFAQNALKDLKKRMITSYCVAGLYFTAQWIFVYTILFGGL